MPIINPLSTNSIGVKGVAGDSSLGKDAFMKILVAQMEAQDPLSPMEGQEFASQLAEFSSLEQLTNVNGNLETMQSLNIALSNNSTLALIGKSVDAPGNTIDLKSGEIETLSFSVKDDASEVSIDIYDSTGVKVNTVNLGAQDKGIHEYIWSGRDTSGSLVPPGMYTFSITASDTSNNFVSTETFTAGKVTDVIFEDGQAFAVVNGQKLSVSEISKVSL